MVEVQQVTGSTADERRLLRTFSASLVLALFAIPVIASISYSPIFNVFLGLLPLIASLIVDIMATVQHYRREVYWIVLVGMHLAGLLLLFIINPLLAIQLNVGSAIAVSLLLGVLVTVIAWWEKKPAIKEKRVHTVEFKKEKLPEYVQSIEDKVKAMNFVIGRVYRASNGGSEKLREKLRIPREWYNEFYEIKPEELIDEQHKAAVLIRKIHDRLRRLAQKEKDVFSDAQLKNLKNIARSKSGEDAIIDVLKTNDRDPVENYYVSAVDLTERILEELEK